MTRKPEDLTGCVFTGVLSSKSATCFGPRPELTGRRKHHGERIERQTLPLHGGE